MIKLIFHILEQNSLTMDKKLEYNNKSIDKEFRHQFSWSNNV